MSEWKIAKIQHFLKSPEGEYLIETLLTSALGYQTQKITDHVQSFTQHRDVAWDAYIMAHRQLGMLLLLGQLKNFGHDK